MKTLIFFSIIIFCNKFTQAQCTTNVLDFFTNNTEWVLIDNNIGLTNGVQANVIPPLNIVSVYWWDSVSLGKWISCLNTGIHPTNGLGGNQKMKFRYNFKACGIDTLRLDLQIFRDNYCNIYIDNVLVFSDPQLPPSNQINLNVGTNHTFFIPNSGFQTHTLDFEIIEYLL
ncbi:MAG: hypothetical protein R2831_01355 [Chitinophagaceae bacterium]